jgi:hypothetical protein
MVRLLVAIRERFAAKALPEMAATITTIRVDGRGIAWRGSLLESSSGIANFASDAVTPMSD